MEALETDPSGEPTLAESHPQARGKRVDLKRPDVLGGEKKMLRDHSSGLNAAGPCISASLDLDTLLSELVESARAPTDCESCKRLGNQ